MKNCTWSSFSYFYCSRNFSPKYFVYWLTIFSNSVDYVLSHWQRWSENRCRIVFAECAICLRGYFMGPKYFLVAISWVQNIFQFFSRGYFVVLRFFSWVFRGYLLDNLVIFSCWPHAKKWDRNISEIVYSFPNGFQQLWILFVLERYSLHLRQNFGILKTSIKIQFNYLFCFSWMYFS